MAQKDAKKYGYCKQRLEKIFGRIAGRIIHRTVIEVENNFMKVLNPSNYYNERGMALEQAMATLGEGFFGICQIKTPTAGELETLGNYFGIVVGCGLDKKIEALNVSSRVENGVNIIDLESYEAYLDAFFKKFLSDLHRFPKSQSYNFLQLGFHKIETSYDSWHLRLSIEPRV